MQVNRMRLIDADKLYDWVRRECNPYGKPTIDFESGNRMLDMIKRSSTAFDKEKVIEKIKDESSSERFEDVGISGNVYGHYSKEVIDTEEAIEIVEKGGI